MKNLSIITGFLGSGKTTLLNRLLRHPDMATAAVLINELGEVGVDNLIVDRLDEEVVLLESGCVCCSVRDDLTASLLALHERSARGRLPEFGHAVLETTGIADPASILQLLMADPLVCERYRLGAVITVVDASFAPGNLDTVPEAARQVLLADRLVISKADLVDPAALEALGRRLGELNPTARRCLSEQAEPRELFMADRRRAPTGRPEPVRHGHRFQTFQLGWPEPVDWSAVELWIEGLLSARGDDIWRIKGLMNLRGEPRPRLFQSVQHSVYAPGTLAAWPGGRPRTELTFITQHFSRRAAITSLAPFIDASIDD